jgi:hypothetical protein
MYKNQKHECAEGKDGMTVRFVNCFGNARLTLLALLPLVCNTLQVKKKTFFYKEMHYN